MGRLSTALVDRARVVRKVEAGERVEGATPMTDVPGAWFAARLVIRDATERDDAHGGRGVLARGQVVCPPGTDVLASDRLEVRSPLLGDAIWQVVSAPERATTSRATVAVIVSVQRVEDTA